MDSHTTALHSVLEGISDCRFLVVGDLYLDSYIFGQPARVSREAPIMVLEETRREERAGGGSAPALALATLGAQVTQAGVVGNDAEGENLVSLLTYAGINPKGILIDEQRPTTVKTRIVAEGAYNVFPQQISRIDRQDRSPVSDGISRNLVDIVASSTSDVDAIILSDYRSGVVTDQVIDAVRRSGRLGSVDSQGALREFVGLGLIKCNQAEAETVLGARLDEPSTRRDLLEELKTELQTPRLVVTLGAEGAALVSDQRGYQEVPPLVQQQVFDVTGAGDTVIALLTGAIAAGGDDLAALQLSQLAAGIVIAKWGNAQASHDEILAALRRL